MAKAKKVQIYDRKDGDIGLRLEAANGEKMLAGEGYKNKGYAKKLAQKLAEELGAEFQDLTSKTKKS